MRHGHVISLAAGMRARIFASERELATCAPLSHTRTRLCPLNSTFKRRLILSGMYVYVGRVKSIVYGYVYFRTIIFN